MQRPDNSHLHIITSDELPTYWKDERLPTVLEQADSLILWIGDHQSILYDFAEITPSALAASIGLAIPPDNNDLLGISWLYGQFGQNGLFKMRQVPKRAELGFMLERAGWEKYEALRKQRIESRTVFMALKFNEPVLDRVVSDCVLPAVEQTGFSLRILTEPQGAGSIDNQLRAALLSARFVISDLSHDSFGSYWEAGFGEGRGVPVIYMCEKTKWKDRKTHFDTNHMATIIWDIDHLEKAKDLLVATIRATLRAEAKQDDD